LGAEPWYAAIEAGGTKWRVAIGRSPDVVAETTVPTTDPVTTISACTAFIRSADYPIAGVGIASFGPIDLVPTSDKYGFITNTPKPGWSNTDVKSRIENALGVPSVIDVDVGGAALGEGMWGAGRGLDSLVYVTVGTGFGGAHLQHGRTFHDTGHPEMGHVSVERETGDTFSGSCPFHGPCLEGMAAGPALLARWGRPGPELGDRPEVWDLEARYLAQAVRTFAYMLAPQRIILGGGVMQQPGLLQAVRNHSADRLAGYGNTPANLDEFIVAPELGQDAGLIGAIGLARRHFEGG
jgi:fructokinase